MFRAIDGVSHAHRRCFTPSQTLRPSPHPPIPPQPTLWTTANKNTHLLKDLGDDSSENDGEGKDVGSGSDGEGKYAGEKAGEEDQEKPKPLDPFQTFAEKEKQDEFLGELMAQVDTLFKILKCLLPPFSNVWVLVLNAPRPPSRLKHAE